MVVPTQVVPDRPAEDTSSPDDAEALYFAAYDVKMIQPSGTWMNYGLNLDGVETNAPEDPHACRPSIDGDDPALDGVAGIDNQYGKSISPLLSSVLPTAICEMNGSHYAGKGTFVAGIENWNGEPNDAHVTAWIMPAVGAMPTPDGVEPTEGLTWEGERNFDLYHNGAPAPMPCFDGNDYFFLNSDESVMAPAEGETPARSHIYDVDAYIVDNLIIARVPEDHPFTLMSVYRSLPALIGDGYIVGKLSADYKRIEESTLAGRFKGQNIIAVAGEIGACNAGLISTFTSQLEAAADLMVNPELDHTNERCDAISVGIPFKAVAAKIAEVHGPAWAPDNHCALVDEWKALGETGVRPLYNCLGSGSFYSFQKQWDNGDMAHCQNGTLIPGITVP